MPATTRQNERELTIATADPAPPVAGDDGYPVRHWKVNGEDVVFSLKPFLPDEQPRYWYIGVGARLMVKAQTINEHGIQPTILNEVFIDGSYAPRNAWEEHVLREFLTANHVNPDKSRDERHPDGPGEMWRCGDGMCNFACPGRHVFKAHQLARGHKILRD